MRILPGRGDLDLSIASGENMIPTRKDHLTNNIDRHPANRARVAPQGPLTNARPDHSGGGDRI